MSPISNNQICLKPAMERQWEVELVQMCYEQNRAADWIAANFRTQNFGLRIFYGFLRPRCALVSCN